MVYSLDGGHLQSRIESWSAAAHKERVEYSYPLLDKRIVEFCLSVPADYYFSKGKGRYLFRLAAEGLLPGEMLWRDAKLEQFRVNRLLKLTTASLKKMRENNVLQNSRSQYVDTRKVMGLIDDATVNQASRREVMMLVKLVSSVSLLMSREL
jgi:asparagine synthase (glutamine-hydrolysing)